jgi:hypothetical protein
VSTPLNKERLDRIRGLARTLTADLGLDGRWRWIGRADGHTPNLSLATREHGQMYVLQFERAGMTSGQPVFPVRPGDSTWSRMAKAAEIPVFEVCRDATTRDDPRVYRTDVVSFRSPAAEWLAEMDPETVLVLLDELVKARWLLGNLVDDLRRDPGEVDPSTFSRALGWLESTGGLPENLADDEPVETVNVLADLGDYVDPVGEVIR